MAITDPIYISINNQPKAVLEVMDTLQERQQQHQALYDKRRLVPRWLFLAGLPLLAADFLLGYNFLTCTLVAAGLWLAAIAIGRGLRRIRPGGPPPRHFVATRELLHTLRDDPDPRRGVFGHLDLTGAQQPAKKFRDGTNLAGKAMEYYRDEWLNLKTKLYDGNMLRLSAIERVKVRKSYWKRSAISGKNKLKPAKVASGQQIKVRLTVNPEIYEVNPTPTGRPGTAIGKYAISELTTQAGIVDLTAVSESDFVDAADILGVLRVAYDQFSRKA